MKKLIKIVPILILGLISILLQTGKVRFGYGLGDIVYHGITYIALIMYSIILFFGEQIPERIKMLFIILFLLFSIYLMLSMSIWRGGEYKWDGNILAT